jgi:hypothetical protein
MAYSPTSGFAILVLASLSLLFLACGSEPGNQAPERLTHQVLEKEAPKPERKDSSKTSALLAEREKMEVVHLKAKPMSRIDRAITRTEAQWVGSLVASDVSSDHLTSGGFMLKTKGSGDLGKDMIEAMDEEGGGFEEAGGCIWLELYDDNTGFWWTCIMMETASVTNNVDFFTGEQVNTGFLFTWEIKNGKLSIVLEKNLEYKQAIDGKRVAVRTNEWEIKIPSAPSDVFSAYDYFPANGYTLPKKTKWEFFPFHQFGRPAKYKAQTFF